MINIILLKQLASEQQRQDLEALLPMTAHDPVMLVNRPGRLKDSYRSISNQMVPPTHQELGLA